MIAGTDQWGEFLWAEAEGLCGYRKRLEQGRKSEKRYSEEQSAPRWTRPRCE